MLKSILPQLKTLLTSKIRGSTQNPRCRTRASDCPPLYWRLAHLTQGSTHFTSAGNLNTGKSWDMSAPGCHQTSRACPGRAAGKERAQQAPGKPLKCISNIALYPYTTGQKPLPTPTHFPPDLCSGHIRDFARKEPEAP